MTWAEFLIRLHAWKRQEKRDVFMLRELAWITYIAPHLNPKRMKKTKEAFWSLKEKAKSDSVTDNVMRQRIKDAQEAFFKEQKELENASNK